MQGIGRLIIIFLDLIVVSSSKGLAVWFEHLILSDETGWCLSTDCLEFLLGCDTPPLSWNISLAVLSYLQNYKISLRILAA